MTDFSEIHDDLRGVARDALGRDEFGAGVTWVLAAELGWLSLEIPEDIGGAGATFAETAIVLEQIARATAPGAYLGTTVLGVGALLAVGAGERRDALLGEIASGSTRVAAAFAADGNSGVATPAFVLRDGQLNGAARFVVDAGVADRLLLLATADDTQVVVSVAADDVILTPEPVLDESRDLASIEVSNLAVDAADVWPFAGDPDAVAQAVLDRAVVALAIDAIGLMAEMLDQTVAYVSARQQFDRPIGSFQAVKHQCADILVDIHVGRELLDAAILAIVVGDPDATVAAARAKSFLTDAAVKAVGVAMQLHGGIGYTWESGIHRYFKRAMLDRALLGSPSDHRRQLGARLRR